MTKKPSSSNTAATRWARKKPRAYSPATSCCSNKRPSILWSCMAAAAQIAAMLETPRHQVAILRRPALSPMRRPSRSSRWSWPARSTSRSSAHINQAGGKAVGLRGEDGNMVIARKAGAADRAATPLPMSWILGFVGEPERSTPPCIDPDHRPRTDSSAGADCIEPRTARPSTSMPTPSPATSPAR